MSVQDDFERNAPEYARRIHEARRASHPGPSWDELGVELQDMMTSQVADLPRKLAVAGLRVVAVTDPDQMAFQLDAEMLEVLARIEHDRWCAARVAHGWRWGPERDDTARTHPSLVPYDDLCDAEKQKDRDMVLRIPEQLAALGLAVARA